MLVKILTCFFTIVFEWIVTIVSVAAICWFMELPFDVKMATGIHLIFGLVKFYICRISRDIKEQATYVRSINQK